MGAKNLHKVIASKEEYEKNKKIKKIMFQPWKRKNQTKTTFRGCLCSASFNGKGQATMCPKLDVFGATMKRLEIPSFLAWFLCERGSGCPCWGGRKARSAEEETPWFPLPQPLPNAPLKSNGKFHENYNRILTKSLVCLVPKRFKSNFNLQWEHSSARIHSLKPMSMWLPIA